MRAILFLFIPVLFSGCTSVYVASPTHIPLMEEKGDGHVSGSFGLNGFGVQTGYGFTDNVGAVASTNFGKVAVAYDAADNSRYYSYTEGGINYFTDVGTNGRTEFMGLIGNGKSELVRAHYNDVKREAFGRYMKYSLQNNASFYLDKLNGGLSTRVSYINYYEYEDTSANEGDKTSAFFFEPAFFTGLNYKNVTLESQFGYSIPLTEQNDLAFDYDKIRLSVAVKFRFNSL
ncbi:MAG: hypothetical protein WD381_03045 [Balneolaceae bacterium]